VSPLAREMIVYAMRWGPDRDPADGIAERFFAALGALAVEWAASPLLYYLPAARSEELGRAMHFAIEHLAEPIAIEDAARAAGTSARTLARRFATETNTSWRAFVHTARMLRAMEHLSERGARVTDTAFAVGFTSLGAFTQAFTAFAGESPLAYKKRATS
jgi:transcriptional regulator GlxA family with amidase domain